MQRLFDIFNFNAVIWKLVAAVLVSRDCMQKFEAE